MSRYEERNGLYVPTRRIESLDDVLREHEARQYLERVRRNSTANLPGQGGRPGYTAPATGSPITRIGATTYAASSGALPTHITDDIIIGAAVRLNSTPPSLPAGWNNIHNSGANGISMRFGWLLCTSASMSSGTWTSAGRTCFISYRGCDTVNPIGNTYSAPLSGTSGSADTGAITLTTSGNWMINALLVSNAWGAGIAQAPALTGFTTVTGSDLFAMYDAERTSSYAGQSNFYTSNNWRTYGFEIKS